MTSFRLFAFSFLLASLTASQAGDAVEFELHDIEADPGESQNLATQQPGIMKTLVTRLEAWVATLPKEYIKTDDKQD